MDPSWETVHHREVWGTPSEFVVVYCCLLFVVYCCFVCLFVVCVLLFMCCFLLLFIVLLLIVFVIFSTGLLFYLQNMFVLLQKRRVGRFKRHSSSFIGDFGMSYQT